MAALPWMKFYPDRWLGDECLQSCQTATQGIWINLCCRLWISESGSIKRTAAQLGKLCGVTEQAMMAAMLDLQQTGTAEIEPELTNIAPPPETMFSVTSRRLSREHGTTEKVREQWRDRTKRMRERGGGDPDRWTAIRAKILDRDMRMCAYCGRKANTVDHVIPKAKDGPTEPGNLVSCCKKCNLAKGTRTLSECSMSFWQGFDISKVTSESLEHHSNVTPLEVRSKSKEVRSKKKELAPKAPPTEVFQVVEAWQTGWAERFKPVDGRLPAANDADWKQAKNLLAAHGLTATIALVARFLDDTDKFVAERGHILRDLPSRVARYAKGDGPLFKGAPLPPMPAVEEDQTGPM